MTSPLSLFGSFALFILNEVDSMTESLRWNNPSFSTHTPELISPSAARRVNDLCFCSRSAFKLSQFTLYIMRLLWPLIWWVCCTHCSLGLHRYKPWLVYKYGGQHSSSENTFMRFVLYTYTRTTCICEDDVRLTQQFISVELADFRCMHTYEYQQIIVKSGSDQRHKQQLPALTQPKRCNRLLFVYELILVNHTKFEPGWQKLVNFTVLFISACITKCWELRKRDD